MVKFMSNFDYVLKRMYLSKVNPRAVKMLKIKPEMHYP